METRSKGKAKPRNAQSKTAAWSKEGKTVEMFLRWGPRLEEIDQLDQLDGLVHNPD
jgi:hypothetical protein